MPRVDSTDFKSLPREGSALTRDFSLHDVWRVDLDGSAPCSVQDLRSLLTPGRLRSLRPIVLALFFIRSALGRVLRLDRTTTDDEAVRRVAAKVPARLAEASVVPPGTPEGPFLTLYVLPNEAAYQIRNATVHALLVTALIRGESGHRLYWATYLRPVGRITSIYMRLIDPFRRRIVYPGLERWLVRAWRERCAAGSGG